VGTERLVKDVATRVIDPMANEAIAATLEDLLNTR